MVPTHHSPLTVVVADPHPAMATAIADLVNSQPGMATVALSSDRETTARVLWRNRPDVLLLDPSTLGMGGLSALPMLQHASPSTRIVVMAMDDPSPWQRQVERSGAVGYISKGAPADTWAPAIRAAACRAL